VGGTRVHCTRVITSATTTVPLSMSAYISYRSVLSSDGSVVPAMYTPSFPKSPMSSSSASWNLRNGGDLRVKVVGMRLSKLAHVLIPGVGCRVQSIMVQGGFLFRV
jgi:hypothetical protein